MYGKFSCSCVDIVDFHKCFTAVCSYNITCNVVLQNGAIAVLFSFGMKVMEAT